MQINASSAELYRPGIVPLSSEPVSPRSAVAPPDIRLVRVTTTLAGMMALLVAMLTPTMYYFAGQRMAVMHERGEARVAAAHISHLIMLQPDSWRDNAEGIRNVLASVAQDEDAWEVQRIRDESGRVIAQIELTPRPFYRHRSFAPVYTVIEPLFDAQRQVGALELHRSALPLLLDTAAVAALALLLAVATFAFMRILPLRAARAALATASYLASHDALTGLPNRTLFQDRLEQAVALGRRQNQAAAVLCLDIDHFTDVNDTLGHAAGDRLLKRVAIRVATCLRESDTLARLGGDEFAIVQLNIADPEAAAALAKRLIDALSQPFDLDGHEVMVGASVGIALSGGRDGNAPERLLASADLALYKAKGDGGGMFRFFDDGMNQRLQARKAMQQDLRRAIAGGQLELYYQPQYELSDGQMHGVEALLRWHHPLHGTIPPLEFIPLAEEIGLIAPLGEWVLRTACAQAASWPDVRVAVNLSAAQFRLPGLDRVVADALAEAGLSPTRLELEITESVLLHDTDATLATLKAIKAMGVRLAMDDFGTGYSSLSYLRRFPFDKIKIDASFVSDLSSGHEAGAIIRAVVHLGHSLGMTTNAEGVETPEQADILRLQGCDEVQGYYFGRPMSAEDLQRTLQDRRLAGSPSAHRSLNGR